jgi:hypothetical protein
MFLHIFSVTIGLSFLYGYLLRISSAGGSVANARAPRVSIIKFTQSIYTALRGESLRITDPKNTIAIATMLTDN